MPSDNHTKRFFYKLFYNAAIFTLISKLYEPLGRQTFTAGARLIGFLYAITHRDIREAVRQNLRLLCPDSATSTDATRVFTNYAATLADYLCVTNMSKHEATALCSQQFGREHLLQAAVEGAGCILATGHFGFFEYGLPLLNQMNLKNCILTLPEPSDELTHWRASQRTRWNTSTISVGADAFSSLEVTAKLNQGHFCAMLVDRPFGEFNLAVALPGGSIYFSKSPALLALLARCPIIPTAIIRQSDGTYHLIAKEPITIDRSLPRSQAIDLATTQVAQSLIAEFRRFPHQWYHFVPIGV